MELEPCPFCGGKTLYERYAILDGFEVPIMFCNWCKSIFTVEGYEDYVTNYNDGFTELREAWNTRKSRACYADEVTNRNCKYSVHRGWCEHTCQNAAVTPLAFRCGKCGWFDKNRCDFNFCPNCGAKVVE